jgi:Dehydrogenases with different specificities (related to short-chain alcohol dehydrogenases)
MLDLELEGKVAIVTGATRGLGRASALSLAAQGVRVLGAGRTEESLRSLEDESGGMVTGTACDMRDSLQVGGLVDLAMERLGRLDIVVNNAGIAPAGRFDEVDDSVWREVFEVNVFAPVTLTRAAGRVMLENGAGKVINVASTSGILGKPTLAAYSASKGALLQFTKAVAGEWARAGVQVNAIAPGAYETQAQSVVLESEEILKRRLRKIPAGRMGLPQEFGPLVCLLASPLSDFMSGSVVVADGAESSTL